MPLYGRFWTVTIKLNELNRMGWQLNLPYVPHSDFLKNVRPEG